MYKKFMKKMGVNLFLDNKNNDSVKHIKTCAVY